MHAPRQVFEVAAGRARLIHFQEGEGCFAHKLVVEVVERIIEFEKVPGGQRIEGRVGGVALQDCCLICALILLPEGGQDNFLRPVLSVFRDGVPAIEAAARGSAFVINLREIIEPGVEGCDGVGTSAFGLDLELFAVWAVFECKFQNVCGGEITALRDHAVYLFEHKVAGVGRAIQPVYHLLVFGRKIPDILPIFRVGNKFGEGRFVFRTDELVNVVSRPRVLKILLPIRAGGVPVLPARRKKIRQRRSLECGSELERRIGVDRDQFAPLLQIVDVDAEIVGRAGGEATFRVGGQGVEETLAVVGEWDGARGLSRRFRGNRCGVE